MADYALVISSLIETYKKNINKHERLKKRFWRKSERTTHKLTIALLYLRLECLETVKEFLDGNLSDYSKLRSLLGTFQVIIDGEEEIGEHYNASVLECLLKEIKYIL